MFWRFLKEVFSITSPFPNNKGIPYGQQKPIIKELSIEELRMQLAIADKKKYINELYARSRDSWDGSDLGYKYDYSPNQRHLNREIAQLELEQLELDYKNWKKSLVNLKLSVSSSIPPTPSFPQE